jgi:hypothetical protein
MAGTTRKVGLYVRVSTSDGQTAANQERELQAVAERHGWQSWRPLHTRACPVPGAATSAPPWRVSCRPSCDEKSSWSHPEACAGSADRSRTRSASLASFARRVSVCTCCRAQKLHLHPAGPPWRKPSSMGRPLAVEHLRRESAAVLAGHGPLDAGRDRTSIVLELSVSCDSSDPSRLLSLQRECSISSD